MNLIAYSDNELDKVADDIVRSSSSSKSVHSSISSDVMSRRKLQQGLGDKLLQMSAQKNTPFSSKLNGGKVVADYMPTITPAEEPMVSGFEAELDLPKEKMSLRMMSNKKYMTEPLKNEDEVCLADDEPESSQQQATDDQELLEEGSESASESDEQNE